MKMNMMQETPHVGQIEEQGSLIQRSVLGSTSVPASSDLCGLKHGTGENQDSCTRSISSSASVITTVLQWLASVVLSLMILVGVPLSFYNFESLSISDTSKIAKKIVIGWTSLLHVSAWLLLVIVSFVGFFLAQKCYYSANHQCSVSCRDPFGIADFLRRGSSSLCQRSKPFSAVTLATFGLGFSFAVSIAIQSNLQMIHPSWAWNPFLWGGYHIYKPHTINKALEGLCLDYELPTGGSLPVGRGKRLAKKILRAGKSGEGEVVAPLCLSESNWRELSTEALSSRSEEDVDAVLRGLHFAKMESGGIIISIMARDIIDSIEPLRQNVEGLVPFVSNLAVVVFENDSSDGSREAFYAWSKSASNYKVDVIECEVANCRFHEKHRDFATKKRETPYSKTSAIGRMAEFRNRVVTHVLETPVYSDYTHMLVLDMDLGVSLSPLGVLHTLGVLPNETVASSGRQVWPGSFGTIIPPYDFSAFQVHETESNRRLLYLHEKFCALKPKGDRWRNECNAVSPMHTMMVLGEDRLSDKPYIVDSAFNGATLYPINLIRSSGAKYDGGDDGQRCEHIGFNLSLKRTMYVNPQWTMHVSPISPGGPTGNRASQTIWGIASSPVLGPLIFFQNAISLILFVYSVMTLSMKVVYPFWVKMASGSSFFDVAATCGPDQRTKQRVNDVASHTDLESLLNPEIQLSPRKRKVSDFDAP